MEEAFTADEIYRAQHLYSTIINVITITGYYYYFFFFTRSKASLIVYTLYTSVVVC